MAARLIWAALCCCLIVPDGGLSQNLNSLISISEHLASNPQISTIGAVNLVGIGSNETICYLPYLFPFTGGDGIPMNALGQYDGLAAIALAMEHLNTGNGMIIPEVSDLNQRCPLRFTTKAFDTEHQPDVGMDHIFSLTDTPKKDELLPCAILGAAYSSVSISTATISGHRGFPQISPISTSSALDDVRQFRLFGRMVPGDQSTTVPLLAKLDSWNVKHLAVLYIDDAYGCSFAKSIRLLAQRETPDLKLEMVGIPFGADDDELAQAIGKLKDTEFRYFFAIVNYDIDPLMIEAYNQGIVGTGQHTWIFSDGAGGSMLGRDFPVGSILEKAYRGSSVLSAVGGIPGIDSFDKLAKAMQQLAQNEKDKSYLLAQLPSEYPDGKFVNHSIIIEQESFLNTLGIVAPFLYDAVIGLGLASCSLAEISGDEYFTGKDLFKALLTTTFNGTSGEVVFDPETGSRETQSTRFLLTNVVDNEDASVGQDMVQFKGVETDFYNSGKWESIAPYTFNDGTSHIPLDLPALETNPYYTSETYMFVMIIGSVLCGIVVVLALGFGFWTYHNSKKPVVRASQPIFLYILTAGTLLMGLAIIPFTIGPDASCMLFPWMLVIGFSLTFSALFTKTWRINKIMRKASKFQRVKVTATDVMKPMITLLMLNVAVLALWTAFAPLDRVTVIVETDQFGRPVNAYDICRNFSTLSYTFIGILCAINLFSLLFAVYQAYEARGISTTLQESSYIFIAMSEISLVFFIGIPVLVLARTDEEAYYFVMVALIFVICTSILLLIFVPKVWALRKSNGGSDTPGGFQGGDGINVLNTKMAHAELEREIEKLKQENCQLEQLLSKERESNKVQPQP